MTTYKQLRLLLLIVSCLSCIHGSAQENKIIITPAFREEIDKKKELDTSCRFLLNSISIKGNKKTKDYIILREMNIRTGDSIRAADLFEKLRQSRDLIYNTNLFSIVEMEPLLTSAYEFSIKINVIERWYIYPAPQFKLTDRNFNEWYRTYDADLNRVNYGMKFTHYNLSGRGDQLNLIALNGYSRNFYVSYLAPYSNPKLTEGFSFSFNYSQSKEIIYKTGYANNLLLYRSDSFNRASMNVSGYYRKRKGYYNRQIWGVQFNHITVSDSIITEKYNPGFFNLNRSSLSFFDVTYGWQYTNIDNVNYPLKGKTYSLYLTKRGFGLKGGINLFGIDVSYRKYYSLPRQYFTSIQLLSRIRLPFDQPYINRRMMGYGDFYLNGLEYYVIDGSAAFISKFTLNRKLASFNIPLPFKIKMIPYIPFKIYGKTYVHAGYNYTPGKYDSRLNNKLLYTGGFGIDILTLYDLKLSVELSGNQLGEKGLFLHTGK